MPSSSIRFLEIAQEPSFCCLNNGYPDASLLTGVYAFQSIEFTDASQLVSIGEATQTEVNDTNASWGKLAPEADLDGHGDPMVGGSLSFDVYLRSTGGAATGADYGVKKLLQTRLLSYDRHTQLNVDAPSDISSVSSSGFVTSDHAEFASDPVAIVKNDNEQSLPLYITSSDNTNTEPYVWDTTFASAGSDKVLPLTYYYLPSGGGDPLPTHPTVALRITGDGWCKIAFGCSLTALTLTMDGDNRAIKMSLTVDMTAVFEVTPVPTVARAIVQDGAILHQLGAPLIVGKSYSSAVPSDGSGAPDPTIANAYCIDSMTLSLTWTAEGYACGSYYLKHSPLEAVSLDTSLQLSIGGIDAQQQFLANWKDRADNYCYLAIGFGGDITENEGGAIIIPAAFVKDPGVWNVDAGSSYLKTNVTFDLGFNQIVSGGPAIIIGLA
jgi:hypothetical protein